MKTRIFFSADGGAFEGNAEHILKEKANIMLSFITFFHVKKPIKPDKRFYDILKGRRKAWRKVKK